MAARLIINVAEVYKCQYLLIVYSQMQVSNLLFKLVPYSQSSATIPIRWII